MGKFGTKLTLDSIQEFIEAANNSNKKVSIEVRELGVAVEMEVLSANPVEMTAELEQGGEVETRPISGSWFVTMDD